MRIDVHQHLWTEPLVSALSRRISAPYVRGVPGAWTLYTAEGAFALAAGDTAVDQRLRLLDDDGIASDIHRVEHWGTQPAVTLHVYSPPLWRMGAYTVGDDGALARHSMSYAEELRPLTPQLGAAA